MALYDWELPELQLIGTSVNSRLQVLGGENTYLGGKFDAFLLYFGCFSGGGEFGILGNHPKEIAGNNTDRHI